MKNNNFFIKKPLIFSMVFLLLICVSCGSSKKTNSKKTENTEKLTVSTNEKTLVENKLEKDSSLVKKTENKNENTSSSTTTEKTTIIVLKTEKDSLGNTKPASYKEVVNGKTKTEISINGKGEVYVETTEINSNQNSSSSNIIKDSLSQSSKKNNILKKDINNQFIVVDEKNTSSQEVTTKKITSLWFQWWFWLIVLIIAIAILYLQKRFQLFFKLKNLIFSNKKIS